MTVAALYVEPDGCYANLPDVDAWDEARDARAYAGSHPAVAHPPCQRWGRFWHGSTRKPHQFKLGDDGGCFEAALAAVRRWGGVLEHPADSHAWAHFGLNRPARGGGWVAADFEGGWTCYVEQGHYGHFSRKPTWLYACKVDLPELIWGRLPQRLHPVALERYGYEKARRIGVMAMVGGKDKTKIRNATPIEFRDLLLSIARTAVQSNRGSSRPACSAEPANGDSEAGGPSRHQTSPCGPASRQTPARSCVGVVEGLFAIPRLAVAPDFAVVADVGALAEPIGKRTHHDPAAADVAVADVGLVTERRPLCAQAGQRVGHELPPAEPINHEYGAEHLGCSVAVSNNLFGPAVAVNSKNGVAA